MGLVFSWLWGRREPARPLPGVAAETQVSSHPHLPSLHSLLKTQKVDLTLEQNIMYQLALSELHSSDPPSSSPTHSPCKLTTPPPTLCILSFLGSTYTQGPLGPPYPDPAHGFWHEKSLLLWRACRAQLAQVSVFGI